MYIYIYIYIYCIHIYVYIYTYISYFVYIHIVYIGTVRTLWKAYTQEMLPHAVRNIRNFMLNSLAEGRNDENDEDAGKGPSMTCMLTMPDVENVLDGQRSVTAEVDHDLQILKAVDQSTDVAMKICSWKQNITNSNQPRITSILDRHKELSKSCQQAKPSKTVQINNRASVAIIADDWPVLEARYKTWHAKVYVDTTTITPTQQQAQVLQLIHRRCKYEYFVEQQLPLADDLDGMCSAPLYRLIHGLPGAGKSQVLLWIRDYFITVWHWVHGDEFVFVAGMNSMADNIGGATLHSYFGLPFQNRRGAIVNSTQSDENWNKKLTKMSVLRYIFIDEIEAAGAELIGHAEEETLQHTRRPDVYRYPQNADAAMSKTMPRPWGGVNVMLIGDWWQLHPTGSTAIMSNPLANITFKIILKSNFDRFWLPRVV